MAESDASGSESSSQVSEAAASAPAVLEPEEGSRVAGRVDGLVKGGFEVLIDGFRAYCPGTQIDLRRVDDPSAYLGQSLPFDVVGKEPGTGRLLVSRRRILEEEARERRAEARRLVVPGAVLTGRVIRLTEVMAAVDLGIVVATLHVSEISHRRLERPADVLGLGQEVRVRVERVEARTSRVSVSMKALEDDPWKEAFERLRAWDVVDGRILRAAEFGAFLEVLPGVEGLLHRSELPSGALERIAEAAPERPLMSVVVLEIDKGRRRLSLAPAPRGLAAGDRLEPVRLAAGALVSARVEEIKPFGVCVRLGPGQTGVIANPEMGTPRGTDHKLEFPPGTEITAEVLSVESGGRRAKLSRGRAVRREERAEVERHAGAQGSMSLSTLGDLIEQARARARQRP